jgi:hypothetical protein
MTSQTDIAIVGFAQTPAVGRADEAEVQLCLSVISEAAPHRYGGGRCSCRRRSGAVKG